MTTKTYRRLTLNTCLGPNWEAKLDIASRYVLANEQRDWAKVAQAAREYRPTGLARLREAVIDWLNG